MFFKCRVFNTSINIRAYIGYVLLEIKTEVYKILYRSKQMSEIISFWI